MIRYSLISGIKVNKFSKLAKESGWILVGHVVAVLSSITLIRILTEFFDPSGYGELALSLTIAILINQVGMGGLISSFGRFYSIAIENNDLNNYLEVSVRSLMFVSICLVVIWLAVISFMVALSKFEWIKLSFAILVLSVISSCNGALSNLQNAARQRKVAALHKGADSLLKIALVVAFVNLFGSNSTAVVSAYATTSFVVLISQYICLRRLRLAYVQREHSTRSPSPKTKVNWTAKIWAFSWPFSVWGIFIWAQGVSDRWALELFTTSHEVGRYAVVFQLGYVPMGLLIGLLMLLLEPLLYQKSGDATDNIRNAMVHNIVWRISLICLGLTGLTFVLALLVHEELFQWMVSADFRDISEYWPWALLAGGFFAVGQMLSVKFVSEIKVIPLMYIKIVTAVIGLGLNIMAAWWHGTQGVIAALIFFSTIYMIWMGAMVRFSSHSNAKYLK